MGASIGADVPFFLFGRPALATGIGERLTAFDGLDRWKVVVIYPGFSIPTASVYKKLNLGLTKCENHLKSFSLKQNGFLPAQHLCNDLETVVIPQYPEIAAIKRKLLENGATGALMSGSGSSVFGMFADSQTARLAGKALALIESGGFDHCMISYGYIPRGHNQIWSARMTTLRNACLARAHASPGDGARISGYLGKKDSFPKAIGDFATAYADQTERDYQALVEAVQSGRIDAETGI